MMIKEFDYESLLAVKEALADVLGSGSDGVQTTCGKGCCIRD